MEWALVGLALIVVVEETLARWEEQGRGSGGEAGCQVGAVAPPAGVGC